jgi:hypothetical protein
MGAVETMRTCKIPFVLAEINRFALRQAGTSETTFRLFMHHLGYVAYCAESIPKGTHLVFKEIPWQFVLIPDNPEANYNMLFCLPGQLETYGMEVVPFPAEVPPR